MWAINHSLDGWFAWVIGTPIREWERLLPSKWSTDKVNLWWHKLNKCGVSTLHVWQGKEAITVALLCVTLFPLVPLVSLVSLLRCISRRSDWWRSFLEEQNRYILNISPSSVNLGDDSLHTQEDVFHGIISNCYMWRLKQLRHDYLYIVNVHIIELLYTVFCKVVNNNIIWLSLFSKLYIHINILRYKSK